MPYSKKDTKYAVEQYLADPGLHTVKRLCIELNKTPRSIISKLSNEGVYQKTGYRDKTGAVPIKKSELVQQINDIAGVTFLGLEKAPKQTLKALLAFVEDQDTTLEDCLTALNDAAETSDIKSAMLRQRIHTVK